MKYTKWFVILMFAVLAFLSFASLTQAWQDNQGTDGQAPKRPKFRLAPAKAKNVQADRWSVSLDPDLSPEQFERELQRLLKIHDARIVPADPTLDMGPDALAKYPNLSFAVLQMPEVRAREMAKDPTVVEVFQVHDLEINLPEPTPSQSEQLRPEASPKSKSRLPGTSSPKGTSPQKREKPFQPEIGTETGAAAIFGRITDRYNLDRIDSFTRFFNGIYGYTNAGDGVDIYFFDTGVNVAHPDLNGRATMLRSAWLAEDFLPNPPDHGTAVMSAAIGEVSGTADNVLGFMIRVVRVNGIIRTNVTAERFANDIDFVRQRITIRRPRRAVVNFSMHVVDSGVTEAMRQALTRLINTDAPIFAAISQVTTASPFSGGRSTIWPQNNLNVTAVGMTDSDDDKVNYVYTATGELVNQFAPVDIFAPAGGAFTYFRGPLLEPGIKVADANTNGYRYEIGSSFACPQVAGVAAMYLSIPQTYAPQWRLVREWLYDHSTKNFIPSGPDDYLESGDKNQIVNSAAAINVNRNSGSYQEGTAPMSLATGFGDYSFLGVPHKIEITDGRDVLSTQQPPYYADTGQFNFLVPLLPPNSTYNVKVYNSGGFLLSSGPLNVNTIAPGIFTYFSSGSGTVTGQLFFNDKVTGAPAGSEQIVPGGNVWNPATRIARLVFYGTGWRGQTGSSYVELHNGSNVYLSSVHFPIEFIGPSAFAGQDQFNTGPLPDGVGNNKGTWTIKFFVSGPGGQLLQANNVTFIIR